MSEKTDIKAAVKERYARAIQQPETGCCGGSGTTAMKGTLVQIAGYRDEDLAALDAGRRIGVIERTTHGAVRR